MSSPERPKISPLTTLGTLCNNDPKHSAEIKMKSKMLLLLTLSTMSITNQGYAGYYTSSNLFNFCESELVVDQNSCRRYLSGISDAHDAFYRLEFLADKAFCIPDRETNERLREIFIKYVNEHPQDLELVASSMAINAFRQAFPCK
jgi:hypothetical protein